MSHKEDWLTKEFDFDFPATEYQGFLDFLRQTPSRLRALLENLPDQALKRRDGDSWSIQENAGHFLTVESLFLGRLDDYINDVSVLRPARFEENPTGQAKYNEKDIGVILEEFNQQRAIYMAKLDLLPPEGFGKTALHPRLNEPMRICDMLHFHAEHDRHHLARIEELKQKWGYE
jgi:uncharacterized damage-inducible protein DinB